MLYQYMLCEDDITMADLQEKRAERLKKERKAKKLTQIDMCNIIGVVQGNYSKYETGKGYAPLSDTLLKISEALGVSMEYLLCQTDYKSGLKDSYAYFYEALFYLLSNSGLDISMDDSEISIKKKAHDIEENEYVFNLLQSVIKDSSIIKLINDEESKKILFEAKRDEGDKKFGSLKK